MHAGPCRPARGSTKGSRTRTETYSRQNASNELAACHGKGQVDNHSTTSTKISGLVLKLRCFPKGLIYLLADSHIRLTTLSSVSKPPSFKALVRDLDPCSLVANSSKPSRRWSRVIRRCFSDPCSKTER